MSDIGCSVLWFARSTCNIFCHLSNFLDELWLQLRRTGNPSIFLLWIGKRMKCFGFLYLIGFLQLVGLMRVFSCASSYASLVGFTFWCDRIWLLCYRIPVEQVFERSVWTRKERLPKSGLSSPWRGTSGNDNMVTRCRRRLHETPTQRQKDTLVFELLARWPRGSESSLLKASKVDATAVDVRGQIWAWGKDETTPVASAKELLAGAIGAKLFL
jgi:hypothetical protein